jgi:predicted permease
MIAVIAALVPVFLLIATGFALRRWLIQQDAHWIGLERILYYVMFPALLVESLSRADLAKVPVLAVGGTLLTAVLLMSALCLTLRPLLARRLGVDGPAFTSLFQGATRWQTFVALAVAGNLYGDLGLALASVAMVAMIPVLNALAVWVLARYATPTRPDWRGGHRAKPIHLGLRYRPCAQPACGVGSGSRARFRRRTRTLLVGARPADRWGRFARRRIDPPECHDVSRLRAQARGHAGHCNFDRRSTGALGNQPLGGCVLRVRAGLIQFLRASATDGR